MAVLAGIDEAGLGPMLGPLVVSGVAFRVGDDRLDACLWKTLRQSCAATAGCGRGRLVVADSKKLYRSRRDLSLLERPALVMLAAAGWRPRSWRALLDHLAPGASLELEAYPWYAGGDVALPVGDGTGDIGTQANAVRRDWARHDIALQAVRSEALPAGRYNRLVHRTQNKAAVLLGLALRLIDRMLRSAPHERVRLSVDRLGGRRHYRDALREAFPASALQILEESAVRSRYRLDRSGRRCEIEFVTGGESRHFPVALASLYSKYVRELYMHVFNGFWSRRVAGLRPTAGYYADARRWLREAAGEIERASVDPTLLVRQR